jgi:opacity protein-like surface antigen
MNQKVGSKIACLILWGAAMLVQAGTMGPSTRAWYTDFEISGAGGPNWFRTDDTTLIISPFETDSNLIKTVSNRGAWKVGIGYYFFEDWLPTWNYLNHLLFEVNVYQISGTIKGAVWQYQLPQFYNYNFRAPFTSTRLMFDFKPYLFAWNRISSYLILGVGPTWNTISYREKLIAPDVPADTTLAFLDKYTSTRVAGDVGVGLSVNLTRSLSLTAEYVYGFLGNSSSANSPTYGVLLADAPSFSFKTQTLLFGLSLKL